MALGPPAPPWKVCRAERCGYDQEAYGGARAYLEHVCVTVMCVLDYDRVAPGQCVRDAMLAPVTQCLVGRKEKLLPEACDHKCEPLR